MDIVILGAEALFLALFVATFAAWIRRRDPVSRAVMLAFSALAVLFVLEAWRRVTGQPVPTAVSQVGTGLFVLQPLFTLHLVSLVRPVPRWLVPTATAASLGTGVPAILLSPNVPVWFVLLAFAVLVVNQLAAAALLLGEGRRRQGPAAARFGFAAVSTALFAVALLIAILGAGASEAGTAGTDVRDASRIMAGFLALVAGLGYVLAFLPPGPVRSFWQAETALAYGRDLVAGSDEPVASLWARFARLASAVTGCASVIVMPLDAERGAITATSRVETGGAETGGVDARDVHVRDSMIVPLAELAALRSLTPRTPTAAFERRASEAGGLAARLARAAGATFVSAVPIEPPNDAPAGVLLLLSPYRSLFQASDVELLASLGAQTAMEAQRRAVVAEQEALSQRLAATNEVLRSASQAKSDFLASMSHELRTPLSAILGFSDLMRHEPAKGEDVVVPREWVELIHRGGEHLLALINDVLDLAKVEAGRLDLNPEPLDLAASVTELLNGVRPLAERKRLALHAAVPATIVHADRGRLRQILYNLLSNAIKYTAEGGSVRVDVEAIDGWAAIAVTDTGIGIAPEDQAAVFEEFRQVGDPTERQEGTGLGLALTRRLAEAHGGRIELASERGKGSRFTVFLPLDAGGRSDDQPVARADRAVAAARSGVDLLVIEDDPGAVRLLREYLEPSGYEVRVATEGESGIAMAAERRPSAIILDVLLPGVDGWEVLRRLKGDAELRDVPVVIVTVVDERQVGLALGAVDYLVKPIEREALVAVLNRLLGSPHTSTPVGPQRVLAIDDEPAARALIRAALEPDGHRVVEASGGRDALDRLAGEPFDLVVCDLLMPGIDGFEVIAAMKADPRTAGIPIVVCTAHDLAPTDKARLNGHILGIVAKGEDARTGLREWVMAAVSGAARTNGSDAGRAGDGTAGQVASDPPAGGSPSVAEPEPEVAGS